MGRRGSGRRTAILPTTKTGKSMRPLSHVACDLLEAMEISSELIFPARVVVESMAGFRKFWDRISEGKFLRMLRPMCCGIPLQVSPPIWVLRAYDRSADRAQGPYYHVAICSLRRCSFVSGGRRGCRFDGETDG